MISRRNIRIKLLQALYAYSMNDVNDLAKGEKELLKSIEKIYALCIHHLSLIVEVFDFAETRIEMAKKKFRPSHEELNPNLRFIKNRVYENLKSNVFFQKRVDEYKINWSDRKDIVESIYTKLVKSDSYKDYMTDESPSYKKDRDIIFYIYENYIGNSPIIEQYFEDISIYWNDDHHIAKTATVKILAGLKPMKDDMQSFPNIFGHDPTDLNCLINLEAKEFLIELFRKTIIHKEKYTKMVAEKIQNWDMERVALMDILIMEMALSELINFPTIPVKVTLNEYIEIAKIMSTPRSKNFVNGILDKIKASLHQKKIIAKTGRGLIE